MTEQRMVAMEPGRCPRCGSSDVAYGRFQYQDDGGYFEMHCNKCHADSREWYDMQFVETVYCGEGTKKEVL